MRVEGGRHAAAHTAQIRTASGWWCMACMMRKGGAREEGGMRDIVQHVCAWLETGVWLCTACMKRQGGARGAGSVRPHTRCRTAPRDRWSVVAFVGVAGPGVAGLYLLVSLV